MLTTICSISRQNGVLSTKNTTKHSVTTLTTGKTLEEIHTYLATTLVSYAQTGKLAHSSLHIRRDVFCKQPVLTPMDGKSKSTTLLTTRLSFVKIRNAIARYNVHFTIVNKSNDR